MTTLLVNNNISPLPFYDSMKEWNHRKSYVQRIYPLLVYRNTLMPFQAIVDKSVTSIRDFALANFSSGSEEADIYPEVSLSDQYNIKPELIDKGAYKVIVYKSMKNLPFDIKPGPYFFRIGLNSGSNIYSEIFTSTPDISGTVLVRYANSYNLDLENGSILFDNGFEFWCYLPSEVGKPDYSFDEEATNRMGFSFIESQVSKKTYKFSFPAPEYLCDALRLVRMCDKRRIESESGIYTPTTFSIDAKWNDYGDVADVTANFDTDTVVANLGGYKVTNEDNNGGEVKTLLLVNNHISPLPFYDSMQKWNHRKSYVQRIYPLVINKGLLMPFQIVVDKSVTSIRDFELLNYSVGNSYTDVYPGIILPLADLELIDKKDYKVIRYAAGKSVDIQPGRYFLRIGLNSNSNIYSEIFTSTRDIDGYLLLRYSNSYNLKMEQGGILFNNSFEFRVYLPAEVGKPDYSFNEEASERMGYSFMESQVSKKTYKFIFPAPEYLCDALRLVRMCDRRSIETPDDTYAPIDFSIDSKWENYGDVAEVTATFDTDTVVANLGGYGSRKTGTGDFNDDFNADYYTSNI